MLDIRKLAALNMPLSPAQRAVLKVLEAVFLTGLLAALSAIGVVLSGNGVINWREAALFVGGAFVAGLLRAASKYLSARSEPQALMASATLESVANEVQQHTAMPNPVKVLAPTQTAAPLTLPTLDSLAAPVPAVALPS